MSPSIVSSLEIPLALSGGGVPAGDRPIQPPIAIVLDHDRQGPPAIGEPNHLVITGSPPLVRDPLGCAGPHLVHLVDRDPVSGQFGFVVLIPFPRLGKSRMVPGHRPPLVLDACMTISYP